MYTSSLYDYYEGEGFSATQIRTQNNGAVRFILPDEGITPEELLGDPELLEFMCCERFPIQDSEEGRAHVRLTVPKFDVSSELDLIPAMKQLGITDAIDPSASDFSPLTSESEGVHITSARQDTRVMIDEEGVKAVSVTIMLAGAGQPDRYVDMTMDRPFIFEIVSDTGLPLFVGVIQNPS